MSTKPIAYRPDTVAEILDCSRRHVSRLIIAGKLTARKDGKNTLIDAASVRDYHDSLPVVTGPAPLDLKKAVRP
jgi:excisionase family DNA binding protein